MALSLGDVQNIYYTTRQGFGRQFNYRAFWSQVTKGREIVAANAYAIDSRVGKQQGFQQILRDIGYGSAKGDWDVGITLDLVELAEQVDTVVLASGDGDFDLALLLTAGSLIRSAGEYFPIEESLLMP